MNQLPGTEFNFLIGLWNVKHRRLANPLIGSDNWQEFDGTMTARSILVGLGNMDDNVINFPDDPYRAISLRTYDPSQKKWAIWWLDGRTPHNLDVPVKGNFKNGIGVFLADDTFEGKPILMRFTWTRTESTSPKWEQAFSSDNGATWEVNWTMEFTR